MYVDNLLLLSGSISAANVVTGQTITGTNTSVLSFNTIDLLQNRDMGEGADLYLRAQVTTPFAGLTSLELQVISADDAALTSNVNVIGSSGAIPLARLGAGARHAVGINPRIGSVGQRYLGARYVIVGAGSAGALVADIGEQVQDGVTFYPQAIPVI